LARERTQKARTARHAATRPAPAASTVVGKMVVLGIAPAIMLSALAPTATALTTDQPREPVGPSTQPEATDSALADSGTTEATVETIVVAESPAAETQEVADVTKAEPETGAEAGTVAEGVVELDTADDAGRIAGTVEAPDGFQTVGASWPAAADETVPELQVRTRAADGSWSDWTHLEKQTDSADEESSVGTSTPIYVGEANAVQVATVEPAQEMPDGLDLKLVSSDQVQTTAATTSGTVAPAAATGGPTIITREEWGAAPQCDLPDDYTGATWGPAEGGLKAAAVHHTVNPNDYATVADAMRAIRNDQAYHQNTNGWCDIGYNFLVDKWGNIYEGADGSVEKPIIGAHTGGFNSNTVGVAMLGTYTTASGVTPSAAQQAGVADIAAYRLAEYDVAPTGTVTLTAASQTSGGRYAAGQSVELPRIFAHRDTHATECPGELGYRVLSGIRSEAAEQAKTYLAAEAVANIVQAIYRDTLGRNATMDEIDHWHAEVATDGPGRLITVIEDSTKYRQARIVSAYQNLLGYTPTAEQIATQMDLIRSGNRTVDEVALRLMSTSAYYRATGGTDADYVRGIYAQLLTRTPTDEQIASWSERLATEGRVAVVQSIWNSRGATSIRITQAFKLYLGVAPSLAQVSDWQERLAADDRSDEALRATLPSTSKYAARADLRF
jgi:hypothetical protein